MNNNEIFNEAFGNVDLKYIENTARAPKRKSAILMRVMPIAAAVVILAAGVITAFTMANRNKPEVPGADDPAVVPPVVDTEPERTNTIVEGAFELPEKEVSHGGISYYTGVTSVKAYSYYLKNEKIYIKVGCGFLDNDFAEKLSKGEAKYPDPHPDLLLVDPDPAICVFLPNDTQITIKGIISEGTIIHPFYYPETATPHLVKVFNREDGIPYFGYTTKEYEKYDEKYGEVVPYKKQFLIHYEEIELDFSNVPAGTEGSFGFCFGWWESENGFSSSEGVEIWYCVSEKGVSFSLLGMNNAIENMEKVENSKPDITEAEELTWNRWYS